MMNQEVKAKWLEALRSGDYQQGTGKLRSDDGSFCCLGVLCELAVKEKVIAPSSFGDEEGRIKYSGEHYVLPEEVVNWAETPSSHPIVDRDGIHEGLAVLNDTGSTFTEIADLIEKYL